MPIVYWYTRVSCSEPGSVGFHTMDAETGEHIDPSEEWDKYNEKVSEDK